MELCLAVAATLSDDLIIVFTLITTLAANASLSKTAIGARCLIPRINSSALSDFNDRSDKKKKKDVPLNKWAELLNMQLTHICGWKFSVQRLDV